MDDAGQVPSASKGAGTKAGHADASKGSSKGSKSKGNKQSPTLAGDDRSSRDERLAVFDERDAEEEDEIAGNMR